MKISLSRSLREIKRHQPGKVFRYFFPYLKKQKKFLILGFLSALLQSAMIIIRPWPLKVIFDYVLLERPLPQSGFGGRLLQGAGTGEILAGSIAVFLSAILLEGFFAYRHIVYISYAGQRFIFTVRRKLFAHIQRLSLMFHTKKSSGELVTNLTGDINLLRTMLVDSVMTAASQSLILIGMPVVMLAVDVPLTLIALLVLPALAFVSFRFSGDIRQAAKKQRIHEGRVASTASEAIHAIRVIQSFGRAKYHDERFSAQNTGSLKYGLRAKRLEANLSRVVEFIVGLGICGVLGFGAYRAKLGALTPGDLIVFMAYLGGFFRPLRRLTRVTARLSKAAACGERVMDVLSVKMKIKSKPRAYIPEKISGDIVFKDVSFKYDKNRKALKNLSFRAKPGQFIGIVGPSGSGKTTILSLLLRLYDADSGRIQIDGRNIKDYDVDSLRERFGVILSEPLLFQGTIAENIAYGKPEAEYREIEEAAEQANAQEFIDKLPAGYQTEVAESGATLSAGQKQRITMARAFIKGFDILLVDEPFARLDAISVEEVRKVLFRLRKKSTTFYAAHYLRELQDADKILVLRRGRLIAEGRHEELIESCSWYRRAYKLQKAKRTPKPAQKE